MPHIQGIWLTSLIHRVPFSYFPYDLIVKKKTEQVPLSHWPLYWAREKKHSVEELDRWATTFSRRSASTGEKKKNIQETNIKYVLVQLQ